MADKFQREIEEILNKLDHFPKHRSGHRVRRWLFQRVAALQRGLAIRTARISVSQTMLAGIGIIVVAYLLRSVLQGSFSYLVVLGLILFFTAFVLSLFGGGRESRSRGVYWRGRPANSYYVSGPNLVTQLRAWWRRRRGRG